MRKILLILLATLSVISPTCAQLLVEQPAFPSDTDSVAVTVDCGRGNQGLYNYSDTGNIYVHVGLITSLSSGPADWRYVLFNWGSTPPAAKAVWSGDNKYRYAIRNIRAFFNVPAGETILKVAILFRNGDGSLVQRNSDGSDMYVPVSSGGLEARLVLPPYQPLYVPAPEPVNRKAGDTLQVKYVSNKKAALGLSFNGNPIASAGPADSLRATLHIANPGNQQLIASASDGATTVGDTLQFYVAGNITVAPLPSGVKEGINYLAGDTAVVLVLFAPRKNKVLVIGDFNNWALQPAYQMNLTPDSNYHWLRIGGLVSGTEYAYQYVVDDTLIVADYNTEKVLDKNVDPSIPATNYPGLMPFPSKAGGSLAGVIQTAKPAYNWQVPNFKRPDKSGLVIYELLLRDFLATSNWQTLRDTLAYLKRLGVNAVEVMPFNNFEGAGSWGYNPNFYFAPDKLYGTETALKQFVDACHGQGMAVIMDMVLNHSFGSSPMVQLYFDKKAGVPSADNPWFNQYPTHAFNVGYQFNHESLATKAFTQRVLAYWLTNYHIDGYRFDLAKGFTQKRTCDPQGNNCDIAAWGAYDAGRVAIWDTIYTQLQVVSPGSYCILEMFADNSEQQEEANYGMLLWGNLNDNFSQATMGYGTASPSGGTWDLDGGLYTTLGWSKPGLVVYQESHDEERLMYKNEQYGNGNGSYSVKNITTGLQRNAMAAAFWALLPGPKMFWQFGELGYDYSINTCGNGTTDAGCRTDPKPSGWPYWRDSSRRKLHDVYASMLGLRTLYPGLAVPAGLQSSLSGAFKSLQLSTDSLSVAVIGNFDVVGSSGNITFASPGTWYNYLTGDSLKAGGSPQSFMLAPGEFRVYVNRNFADTGKAGPPVTPPVNEDSIVYLQDPGRVRICPDPVINGNSVIRFRLTGESVTMICIVNGMGQLVRSVNLGVQAKGDYQLSMSQLSLNIGELAGGYYVLRVFRNGKSTQVPFLVWKQ